MELSKKFVIDVTETITRTYLVEGSSEEDAKVNLNDGIFLEILSEYNSNGLIIESIKIKGENNGNN